MDDFTRLSSASTMIILHHSPVHSDPAIMGGILVFRGTHVPAQTILDYRQDGYSLDEFLDFFPSVRRENAEEFLRLAIEGTANYADRPRRKSSPTNQACL
jgi:uncharacterized protein (DUF433 family)